MNLRYRPTNVWTSPLSSRLLVVCLGILLSLRATPAWSQTTSSGAVTGMLTDQRIASSGFHDVRDYGAKGDGIAKDTAAIQAAVDAAAKTGGGTVWLSPGTYLSGSIRLKSNITIQFATGATLKMSPDNSDFDPDQRIAPTVTFGQALLSGDNVENVAITGGGIIDGNRTRRGGPKPIALKNSRHIAIRGLRMQNAPNYNISLMVCEYVDIEGVTILNAYADGIDPDCSRNVRISNVFVDSRDDSVVVKASRGLMAGRCTTENVTVANSVLTTTANYFKVGTESIGDFRNIAVNNIAMYPRLPDGNWKGFPNWPSSPRDEAGISINVLDGGAVDGVVVSNIAMNGVNHPLFIRLGFRGQHLPGLAADPNAAKLYGTIQNVSISNVVATGAVGTATISGIPGYRVGRVLLENINITMKGGERQLRGLDIPEQEGAYSWPPMFGLRPAYAFYARHAEGLVLRNVRVRWQDPDLRPAAIFDDVNQLDLDGFDADTAAGSEPVVWLNQVRGATIRGASVAAAERFLLLTGKETSAVKLIGNDLSEVKTPVTQSPEVPKGAVRETGDIVK